MNMVSIAQCFPREGRPNPTKLICKPTHSPSVIGILVSSTPSNKGIDQDSLLYYLVYRGRRQCTRSAITILNVRYTTWVRVPPECFIICTDKAGWLTTAIKICTFDLTHLCPPVQHLLSERLTSLGIMGASRVPPLNPSETIVL